MKQNNQNPNVEKALKEYSTGVRATTYGMLKNDDQADEVSYNFSLANVRILIQCRYVNACIS